MAIPSSLVSLLNRFPSNPHIFLATSCFWFIFVLYYLTRRKSIVPTNWPVVGMLPGLLANLDHLHEWLTELHRTEGCSFKFCGPWFLGMDFLITCDPADVNHVFNANYHNYPKGEEFLEIFDVLGDGIFNADDESWKKQRKKAHGVISGAGFRASVARCSRDKVENGLLPLMTQVAERGVTIDMQDVFLRLTFDMTTDLVFGTDPGYLSPGFPTVPFARAIDDAMEALFFRHVVPPQCWKAMRWMGIGKERKLRTAWRVIDQFAAQNIAKKREGKSYGHDLLTSYIEAEGQGVDDRFLRDTAVNFMLAGRDTTGVALTWFFWLLSENPEVKSKVLEEVDEQLGERARLDRPALMLEPDEVARLVYLHAALYESLRLFPPVPFEHKAPLQAEVLPSGMKASSREKILFSTYSMGRMEGIWGKGCLEFKPERWISERGRLRHEPSYKFLSFNCGPRTCLGKDVAFVQMKTVVAAVMCNFDVEIEQGHAVEPKLSIILHMKNGLKVRVKKRTRGRAN